MMVFGAEFFVSDDRASVTDNDGSVGKALKNFSSFSDSSVALCLIHPTVPVLVLTKYHLAPSPAKVSARGNISSPLFNVATTTIEDSSGLVNSSMLPIRGMEL
jgi:hypothetical protein